MPATQTKHQSVINSIDTVSAPSSNVKEVPLQSNVKPSISFDKNKPVRAIASSKNGYQLRNSPNNTDTSSIFLDFGSFFYIWTRLVLTPLTV